MTTLNLALAVWSYLRGIYAQLNKRKKEKARDVSAPQALEQSHTLESK